MSTSPKMVERIEQWPVERLVPYDRNARTHSEAQIGQIAASITQFGFNNPVLIDSSSGIIAGHGRYQAARKLGLASVPVIVLDHLTDAQRRAYIIADNKLALNAGWDEALLAAELTDIEADFDLSLLGFDEAELEGLLARKDDDGRADECPDVPETPVTRRGDLWVLGRHRVLCGDATSAEDVARVMGGAKADMVFTDPPYGVNIVRRKHVGGGGALKFKGVVGGDSWVSARNYAEIANDDSTEAARRFYAVCRDIGLDRFILFGGNYFADFLPPSACWIVWDKQNTGNFADVELAWTSMDRGAKLYSFMWNGLARSGDRASELVSRVHPTQKPVGLFEKIFADFEFELCLDGFLGSGSTLIACEKTKRICYGTELSEAYCDVIVKRWQEFTGNAATLDGDGRTFAEVSDARTPQAICP